MNKFSIRFMTTAIVLYLLLSVGACSEKNKSQSSTQEPKSISNDWIENATAWTDSVMQMMTLEEMVGQLFMPASYASSDYFIIACSLFVAFANQNFYKLLCKQASTQLV